MNFGHNLIWRNVLSITTGTLDIRFCSIVQLVLMLGAGLSLENDKCLRLKYYSVIAKQFKYLIS